MRPRTINSVAIAIQTPFKPKGFTRIIDRGTLTHHKLNRHIRLGARVSPAPLNTPEATILAAKKGSAKASILRIVTPRALISGSRVKIPIIIGAKKYIKIPVIVIMITPVPMAM